MIFILPKKQKVKFIFQIVRLYIWLSEGSTRVIVHEENI